ncbi:hypothetical protein [Vibrio methylphosphonaticus]|uniref:hypothetical protein n=1 Tax=Vibrio methylphosphonaticus TaxID=2946866 RepID=UPI002029F2F2|nr:hypothetical protein [Vibrio methylphosphonaticus]MCL9775521.1 hypothetical protein [Vibrio methylphosphonaticus]
MECSSLTLWVELPETRFALAWGPIEDPKASNLCWKGIENDTAATSNASQFVLELKTKQGQLKQKRLNAQDVSMLIERWKTIEVEALTGQDLDLHW